MTTPDADILARVGIHIDELNRLRLLNPEIADTFSELHNESKEFRGQLSNFKTTADTLIQTMEELATLVEAEKLKAIASRTALKAADKQKNVEAQQTQIVIREKQVELERLRAELSAVQQIEASQKDYLQQIIDN